MRHEEAANRVADALWHTLLSAEVDDASGNPANVVDVLEKLSRSVGGSAGSLRQVAGAITPLGSVAARDRDGNYVGSLTEACMSIASSIHRVAEAIESLADSVGRGSGAGESE